MASLVALLSSGRGTWTQVLSLITVAKWDRVYLVCDAQVYAQLPLQQEHISKIKLLSSNREEIYSQLSLEFKSLKEFEVAVNIESGTGDEHMALLSALLKSGLGLRFVYAQDKTLKEFDLLDQDYSLVDK